MLRKRKLMKYLLTEHIFAEHKLARNKLTEHIYTEHQLKAFIVSITLLSSMTMMRNM